jgi:aspartyl-tRNA(Asn)/glutamyl-tRNA(Gln) amidotransferase subunit A
VNIDIWLQNALADADRRGLSEIKPLLESLAQSTRALRAADFSTPHPEARGRSFTASGGSKRTRPTYGASQSLTIEEFGRKLRNREISSAEVTDECLRRIEADNSRLNAFILVTADEARRQARAADEELADGNDRGPLHGVPISLKDLIDLQGTATTAASRVREGHVATADAPIVTELRHAGAVFVGKTNLHEFAFGTTNEDSAFGPARNPYDPARSPGGSSGGSAVSVVAGMALGTIGTDTGGSIRIPAAACGLVGVKPTLGEISTDRVVPLSRTLDHAGPLASTVTDAWHIYHALRGRPPVRPLSAARTDALQLALPRKYFCDILDDGVREQFEATLDVLQKSGARVEVVDIPNAAAIAAVYLHISFPDAAAYHAPMLEKMPEKYTQPVRQRLEAARYLLAEDYARALDGRAALTNQVDAVLSGYDALILPTLPIPAPELGAASVQVGSGREPVRALMLRLTQLFNLTGHPAVSLPAGMTSGVPVGVQLAGARGQTDALMSIALAVERTLHESGA